MLISKNVFEKVRYGLIQDEKWKNFKMSDEIGFILGAKKIGFDSYCFTKIECEHLLEGKFRKEGNKYSHPLYD